MRVVGVVRGSTSKGMVRSNRKLTTSITAARNRPSIVDLRFAVTKLTRVLHTVSSLPMPPDPLRRTVNGESSPRFSDGCQSLEIVVVFDPALYSELGQEGHHSSDRDAGKLRRFAKRCFSLLVPFHPQ